MRAKRCGFLINVTVAIFALLVGFVTTPVIADVRLPRLMSSSMVLQRNATINVWGWADANENIAVSVNGKTLKTTANTAGDWLVRLPPMAAGGPYTITIEGKNTLVLNDVLFGDVWLSSGQSNMDLPLARVQWRFPEHIAAINNTHIRLFEVPDNYNFHHPVADVPTGEWKTATQENILKFSAVSYFFAEKLNQSEDVPIGIINASVGGTPVEAWLSEKTLSHFKEPYAEALKFRDENLIKSIEQSDSNRRDQWYASLEQHDKGVKEGEFLWAKPEFDASGWATTTIPNYWSDITADGQPSHNKVDSSEGVVWFRKTVTLTAKQIKALGVNPAQLILGVLVDADQTFVNGHFVGRTYYMYPPRRYAVKPEFLKPGENTIAVRLVNERGVAGFVPEKDYVLNVGEHTVNLAGSWQFNRGATLPRLESQTFVSWKPLGLFNGMIAPLTPYTIKGVIWYQGESNVANANFYSERFTAMIQDWRTHWGQGDFPFLYVQLANYVSPGGLKNELGDWPIVREAQLQALKLPNTAMTVTIDIGEWNDIHPLDKKTVAHRLAASALNIAYHKKIPFSGPIFETASVKGKKVAVTFKYAESGLMAKAGKLSGFEVAGQNGEFFAAKAKIKGNKIIVSSDKVKQPAQLRYGWLDNPEGANLFNKDGFPASPFRVSNL